MRKFTHEEIQKSKPSVEEAKLKKRTNISLILDNIRSMHNIGAIFRSSEGALIEKIYLCGISATPPRPEIEKTALGATEIVPFEYYDDTSELIEELKNKGVKVVALELADGATEYNKYELDGPTAIVLGNEVYGVSDEVMDMVDDCVYIPMHGRANSLNVATACGIVCFEFLKKYKEN
jgi:tRNA G18 (ribose-2'-O)-methylase SpoU